MTYVMKAHDYFQDIILKMYYKKRSEKVSIKQSCLSIFYFLGNTINRFQLRNESIFKRRREGALTDQVGG